MDSPIKLQEAVCWLQHNLSFDMDQRVHVFEVTIRVLGMCPAGQRVGRVVQTCEHHNVKLHMLQAVWETLVVLSVPSRTLDYRTH